MPLGTLLRGREGKRRFRLISTIYEIKVKGSGQQCPLYTSKAVDLRAIILGRSRIGALMEMGQFGDFAVCVTILLPLDRSGIIECQRIRSQNLEAEMSCGQNIENSGVKPLWPSLPELPPL